jgi:hypothetical protein
MKKTVILFMMMFAVFSTHAQIRIKVPGVKWEEGYNFDKCNDFKIEAYSKNGDLKSTGLFKIYYQSDGENFLIKLVMDGKGNGIETLLDKKNEVAIQIFGSGGGAKPFYNTGGYKYPGETELKKLELVPTNETRQILNLTCKKYTYTYKKIFGEVWITDQISLPNDVGVFRACKMTALHNTLSVAGFVMEMTTEDANGGKTLMKTVSLQNDGNYTVDLKGVEMNTSINKVNYFTF